MEQIVISPSVVEAIKSIVVDGSPNLLSGEYHEIQRVFDELECALNFDVTNQDKFIQDLAISPLLLSVTPDNDGLIDARTMADAINSVGKIYYMVESYGDEIYEGYGRPSKTLSFVKVLEDSGFVENIVKDVGLPDGRAFLVRTIDGNAYEVQVRPAGMGHYFHDETKRNQYGDRKAKAKQTQMEAYDISELLSLAGIGQTKIKD